MYRSRRVTPANSIPESNSDSPNVPRAHDLRPNAPSERVSFSSSSARHDLDGRRKYHQALGVPDGERGRDAGSDLSNPALSSPSAHGARTEALSLNDCYWALQLTPAAQRPHCAHLDTAAPGPEASAWCRTADQATPRRQHRRRETPRLGRPPHGRQPFRRHTGPQPQQPRKDWANAMPALPRTCRHGSARRLRSRRAELTPRRQLLLPQTEWLTPLTTSTSAASHHGAYSTIGEW